MTYTTGMAIHNRPEYLLHKIGSLAFIESLLLRYEVKEFTTPAHLSD